MRSLGKPGALGSIGEGKSGHKRTASLGYLGPLSSLGEGKSGRKRTASLGYLGTLGSLGVPANPTGLGKVGIVSEITLLWP